MSRIVPWTAFMIAGAVMSACSPGDEKESGDSDRDAADSGIADSGTADSDIADGGSDTDEGPSAGCGKTALRLDAQTQLTMEINGTTRYYLVYMPKNYAPNTPLPLVFVLHGGNMNNWWAANDASGFQLIQASGDAAILVYPQGSGDPPGTTSEWGGS